MKMYSREFVVRFVEEYCAIQPFMRNPITNALDDFEKEYYRALPKDYPFEQLVDAVCGNFGCTQDEFYSRFRYGSLPIARQVVLWILKEAGASHREMADLTGFTMPRVINTLTIAKKNIVGGQLSELIDTVTEKFAL